MTIRDNLVARTNCCAGIYLASERSWNTGSVDNVLVRGNVLTDNGGRSHHGAIMLFADNGWVRNVDLEQNTIVGARDSAVRLLGTVFNVNIVGNRFVHPREAAISGLGWNVFCADNTLDGHALATVACTAQGRSDVAGAAMPSGWQASTKQQLH